MILPAANDTKWFQKLHHRTTVCLHNKRMKFHAPVTGKVSTSHRGIATFYFGPNVDKFEKEFADVGSFLRPSPPSLSALQRHPLSRRRPRLPRCKLTMLSRPMVRVTRSRRGWRSLPSPRLNSRWPSLLTSSNLGWQPLASSISDASPMATTPRCKVD